MAEKSIYVSRLNSIQNQVHISSLKPNGFAKSGRTHCRRTDDGLFQVITFQIGQSYCDDTDKFWVNIGVRVPESFELSLDPTTEKKIYQEYHCNIRTRLFKFTEPDAYKGYADKYFSLQEDDTSRIADEIISLINKYVMPFFSDLESREKVLANRRKYMDVTDIFNNNIDLEFAMIYAGKGDMEKANEFINKQIASAVYPEHCEYVKEIANKIGLTIQEDR